MHGLATVTDAPARDARAVLLDLGGVLIHVRFERALAHWAAAAGRTPDAFAGRFSPDAAYERHELGELDFAGFADHLREMSTLVKEHRGDDARTVPRSSEKPSR